MKIFCILSDERAYRSKSPEIFTNVLKDVGINGTYVPFKVAPDQIGQALKSLSVLNIAGANVTVPYKEAVIPFLDVLSEGANIIGAVNTIVRNGEELKGYNTNAIGIMDALTEAKFDPEGKTALVFGTGGAARATTFILNWLRTGTIYVVGRDENKTKGIINQFGGKKLLMQDMKNRVPPVDIVVNATSVSSADESADLAALVEGIKLPRCELVLDLNYGRTDNFWETLARRNGVAFMDGLPPLAYQARRTLALWTGLQIPPEAFLNAMEKR